METIKNCVICGKEFTAKRSTAKYCSAPCREHAANERCKRRYRGTRRKKNKATGEPIWQINEEARNLGLTYGKYKAMQYMEKARLE